MDTVYRFLLDDLDIRGALVQLGPAWEAMHGQRGYAEPVRNLLGELAAVTALIGSNLKAPGRITFQLQGMGPISLLVMDCDEQLRLRGMARSELTGCGEEGNTRHPVSLNQLLGDGQLVLTLQVNAATSQYQSVVPKLGDSLAAIFEHFLAQSEQQPARLWLAATGTTACGLFLQKLPGADVQDADGWNRIEQLASTVQPEELVLEPQVLLKRLFGAESVRLFPARSASWNCPRNEEKVRNMLLTLGRVEVENMLSDADVISVEDEICGHVYRFGPEVLDELFPPAGRVLH